MKILVTGGAGFIGSHVAEELLNTGNEVVVLDDFSSGRRENIEFFLDNAGFHLIQGDIRDYEMCVKASEGVQGIVHLAAVASVEKSIKDPDYTYAVNVQGSENMLKAASANGVKRFVYASSAAVYGDCKELPLKEELTETGKAGPQSPYGAHKLQVEKLCTQFHGKNGLEVVVFRFFNVFGERQDPKSPYSGVISIFMDRIGSGEKVCIHGDGEQTRDFIYVKDVVKAIVAYGLKADTVKGEVYNIGRGGSVSIKELYRIISEISGKKDNPEFVPARPGDIKHSLSDSEKFEKESGLKSETSVEEGLRRMRERR